MLNLNLTPRQAEILSFIQRFVATEHRPPTQAQITQAMGFSSRTATKDHLRALASKGVLQLTPGSSRGIRLLDTPGESGLPLIGRVAAGQPLLALEHIESYHPLPADLFHARADYLLRVAGASMCDAGILDGDLLAVQRRPEARNGQIIVARLEDEVTVKRFFRHGRQVELRSENPDFAPLRVDLSRESLTIEGHMVGLIRPAPSS